MKKNLSIKYRIGALLIVASAIPFLASCGDDGARSDTPPAAQVQQFKKLDCAFTATANADFLEMVDMKMVVSSPLGEQTFKFGAEGRVKFTESISTLPADYTVKILVERKPGFLPVEGKQYDIQTNFEYDINLTDTKGNPIEATTTGLGNLSMLMQDVDMSQLDELFSQYLLGGDDPLFPTTYSFRIERKSEGYVIEAK